VNCVFQLMFFDTQIPIRNRLGYVCIGYAAYCIEYARIKHAKIYTYTYIYIYIYIYMSALNYEETLNRPMIKNVGCAATCSLIHAEGFDKMSSVSKTSYQGMAHEHLLYSLCYLINQLAHIYKGWVISVD